METTNKKYIRTKKYLINGLMKISVFGPPDVPEITHIIACSSVKVNL
jgi:hypothetical protein